MKSTKISKQFIIYILFILTLLVGFFLNEDIAGGAKYDFELHKLAINFFTDDFKYALLNYDKIGNTHSPVFIIFLKSLLETNEIAGRVIYLIISSLLPLIFFLILKFKYKKDIFLLFLISNIVFLSPYYRATSIWPGDETLSLIFFSISIIFFLRFKEGKKNPIKNKNILFNVIFLAAASYLRPIYCIFSIYFFYELIKSNNKKNLFYYISLNILLSLPAFYYVFILDVNFFLKSISSFNVINSITLTYLTIFFYLIPFLFLNYKKLALHKFNNKDILITISASIIVLIFFNYQMSAGGGFFYYLSLFISKSNFLIYLIFPFAFYFCNYFLNIKKKENLILLIILIFLEIDGQFYVETYDPLFIILLFSLFNIDIKKFFFNSKKIKNISLIYTFMFFVLVLKFVQNYTQFNIIN